MTSGLELRDISHRYGPHRVIADASLTIGHGQIACLLGPSGCGKTTLLRIAAGLVPLQNGAVMIGGRTVAEAGKIDMPPEDRSVGLMFQDYALFPHLTVAENIAFGLDHADQSTQDRIQEWLSHMGLEGYRNRYPHELSGGQQQRVALLRAIAPKPAVLLLDEPFSGLDTSLRSQVRDQTLELLALESQTTMMVTHDPEEAMYMANHLLVMSAGHIVQSGSPIDVYSRPVNAFVAGLFGPLNSFPSRIEADGTAKTPVGTFEASTLPTGTRVEVLIRPENVAVALPGIDAKGTPMRVVWSRSIGRSTHVQLSLDDASEVHVTARIPGPFSAGSGDPVVVSVAPGDAFVFEA